MKFYYSKASQKIVSLNNITEIKMLTWGSGAKSNPYTYAIEFCYTGGETARIDCDKSKVMAETILEEIFDNLTKMG